MNNLFKTFSIVTLAIGLASCGDLNPNKVDDNEEKLEETAVEMDHGVDADHHVEEAKTEQKELTVPEDASVYFVNLKDRQTVKNPFKVEFGIKGMEVEPAGELNQGKGHHHIIINGKPLKRGDVVPADEANIHYGKGQTETELDLPKGRHTLTLQFADGYHQSYGPQLSNTIVIFVE